MLRRRGRCDQGRRSGWQRWADHIRQRTRKQTHKKFPETIGIQMQPAEVFAICQSIFKYPRRCLRRRFTADRRSWNQGAFADGQVLPSDLVFSSSRAHDNVVGRSPPPTPENRWANLYASSTAFFFEVFRWVSWIARAKLDSSVWSPSSARLPSCTELYRGKCIPLPQPWVLSAHQVSLWCFSSSPAPFSFVKSLSRPFPFINRVARWRMAFRFRWLVW